MMAHELINLREANQALEHFNYFHDGFIQRIALFSRDRFEQNGPAYTDRAHVCTGEFDLHMDIAHFNYGHGEQPHNRRIRCRFQDVQAFHLDLRGHQGHDWPITRIDIAEVVRPSRYGTGDGVKVLELRLLRPRLVEGKRWERQELTMFSFTRAEFDESLAEAPDKESPQ